MRPEDRDATTRAICRERCAFMGEPPCWDVGAWPNEECDEPGCAAMADAALAAAAPLIQKAERERCAALLETIADRIEPPTAKRVNQVDRHTAGVLRDKAAAIRALGDEG